MRNCCYSFTRSCKKIRSSILFK